MKIIEKTCGLVCPVVKELRDENELLRTQLTAMLVELERVDNENDLMRRNNQESEKRIAKARQVLFGVCNVKIVGGP